MVRRTNVIMPDHVHFFCSPDNESEDLKRFMQAWKEWTAKRLTRECGIKEHIWQKEFFDHVLRNEESYKEKWQYVLNNPVRAGLVKEAEEWPWQGEIEML
jgi:putative transposase